MDTHNRSAERHGVRPPERARRARLHSVVLLVSAFVFAFASWFVPNLQAGQARVAAGVFVLLLCGACERRGTANGYLERDLECRCLRLERRDDQ